MFRQVALLCFALAQLSFAFDVDHSFTREITLDEVSKHTDAEDDDLWIVVKGKVLDIAEFSIHHPGGVDILVANAGGDATELFLNKPHSDLAHNLLEKIQIGVVDKEKEL